MISNEFAKLLISIAVPLCLFVFFSNDGCATPEYASETGLECRVCHVDPSGSGSLTDAGRRFLEQKKARGEYHRLPFIRHAAMLLIGYFHMMAAILWFGTIMYVHILLKPAYASQGLPKGELRVGWISMIIVLISGIFLTVSRITSFDQFYTTRFGILLGIKIILFLVMFTSAIIVTLFIGPRLRQRLQSPVAELFSQAMTLPQLAHFNGKEGRPSYIAYKGIIYNVTQGRLWKNGLHAMKHPAGTDLTELLKNAPHGEDRIFAMPQAGTLSQTGQKQEKPLHLKIFYLFAYMNLVLVFVITFVIALWRWW